MKTTVNIILILLAFTVSGCGDNRMDVFVINVGKENIEAACNEPRAMGCAIVHHTANDNKRCYVYLWHPEEYADEAEYEYAKKHEHYHCYVGQYHN